METYHVLHVNNPWYEWIKSGKKIYEGRLNSSKIKQYRKGDLIKFYHYVDNSLPAIYILIEDILHFNNFEQALRTLDIHQILPIKEISLEQGINIYNQYVSIEQQNREGVVMIKCKLI